MRLLDRIKVWLGIYTNGVIAFDGWAEKALTNPRYKFWIEYGESIGKAGIYIKEQP